MRTALGAARGSLVLVVAVVLLLTLAAGSIPAGTSDAVTPPAAALAAATPERPNVVVLMADDMRVDDLRFMPRTRRILGDGGLTFANAFSPDPLCCPARASFLTGQYSHNHGVVSHVSPWGFKAFDDSRTMAVALRKAGYRTGFVGKYLNGYGKQRSRVTGRPSLRYVPPGWSEWYAAVEPPAGSRYKGSTYNYRHVTYNHDGRIDDSRRGEYSTEGIGSITRAMVRRLARGDAPFFVYSSFVAPHFGGPREPDDPTSYLPRRDRSSFRTPARPRWVRGHFDDVVRRGAGLPRGGGPSEKDMSDKPGFLRDRTEPDRVTRRAIRDLTRQRAESLYVLDREVGRIAQGLKSAGAWQDTVLVFTSDNGYFLGEHRKGHGKIWGHEPALRVPLLVTGPGLRTGERRVDPATTVDVTATVLDLAGPRTRRAVAEADGRSLVSTLWDGDQGWSTPVVSEGRLWRTRTGAAARGFRHGLSYVGIRTPQWSYLRYDRAGGAEELYDLANDANQLDSVHDDPAHRAVLRTLRAEWRRFGTCAAEECRRPMDESLQALPERLRALDGAFWRQVRSRHGH